MKFTAVIPARYAASRFPGKLLRKLGNKTIIAHTYEHTVATGLFDEVFVVTDHDLIEEEITRAGGKVLRSKKEHFSGTDRIAEIVSLIQGDVIINVQGDEPFVKKEPLESLCRLFENPVVEVASLMHLLTDHQMIFDPNTVKVVVNHQMEALYFSRSVIPFNRDQDAFTGYYKHIGVYAYKKSTLLHITNLLPSMLEKAEKLEQLRILENGIKIKMAITDPWSISIDTPADLAKAEAILNSY